MKIMFTIIHYNMFTYEKVTYLNLTYRSHARSQSNNAMFAICIAMGVHCVGIITVICFF